jgi:serine phosphatase RsbU (regulator of sigma subunit)/predicted ester cyclase
MQDPASELRRILLLGTWVNKPLADVPGAAGWHHARGVDPLEKEREVARRTSMPAEENMALVRRFWEARAKGDLEAMDAMMAPNFVTHTKLLPGQQPGREGEKWAIAQISAAFSNRSVVVEDQIVQGDKVVSRCIVHLTHDRGKLMGVAPSGRELTWMPIVIHRIEEGKITEQWGSSTSLSELRGVRLEQQERERERVEHELRVARRIQQASLPKEVPTLEGWQISPYYQPAREVGGDFYDFHLLSKGRLGLVVGDATGKGVPAALVMSTTCGMLQLAARASGPSSPSEVLEQVNETLLARIPQNMFVTCFYAILDPRSGSLSYANAGHDLPYLRRRGGDCEELRATGMPLGLMPGMSYEEKETILEAGEAALLYSDGLVEAHDPQGKMLDFPRLKGLVAEHGENRSLGDFLLKELYTFTGEGWEQEDDITLLTLERSASLS